MPSTSAALSSAPRNSLPGVDDITRVELSNGIVVLVRPNFNSPSVVLNGYLQVGSLFDPEEKLGLASFTADALLLGTRSFDFNTIYERLESVAASLSFDGGTHVTGFGGRSLAEDFDLLCTLLASALREPTFPADRVERKRAQVLTGLVLRSQDTAEMASLTFDEILFAHHPYRFPEEGTIETVQRIAVEDLIEFHRRHYGPRGMVVVVVGAIEPSQAVAMISKHLADWQNPEQPSPPELPPVRPLSETTRRNVFIPGKSQVDLVIGSFGPSRTAPEYLSAAIGNNILGQFGLMGRIGDAVREKAGLAYYAHSNLSSGIGPGSWTAAAGVAPENVQRAIEIICREIERFVQEKVSEEELHDSQANFIGRLPLSLETNMGVAQALANLERYGLGLNYYREYAERVRAVTREQVLETAQKYLDPNRLAIAIAGTLE
ncbi:MAG: insulinase family protein [Anaerolineales bacterium]|nr:insulinase family protein [Anaerolineales bacterium]MDW8162462.1 pitrilysin family protein [Anaerolineales bacterium]